MPLYYVETTYGCGIRKAKNIKEARADLLREVGTRGAPGLCRPAKKADIEWVRGMGGHIPKYK